MHAVFQLEEGLYNNDIIGVYKTDYHGDSVCVNQMDCITSDFDSLICVQHKLINLYTKLDDDIKELIENAYLVDNEYIYSADKKISLNNGIVEIDEDYGNE